MEFMNAYKHLEKLCGDLLNDERRISAYIDEMAKISDGTSKVYNWDNDLKKLKHYRWIIWQRWIVCLLQSIKNLQRI